MKWISDDAKENVSVEHEQALTLMRKEINAFRTEQNEATKLNRTMHESAINA